MLIVNLRQKYYVLMVLAGDAKKMSAQLYYKNMEKERFKRHS